MALSKSVQTSLNEATESLRNALAYAARQERPVVCKTLSKILVEIEQIESIDCILDKLEQRMEGDHGTWGPIAE